MFRCNPQPPMNPSLALHPQGHCKSKECHAGNAPGSAGVHSISLHTATQAVSTRKNHLQTGRSGEGEGQWVQSNHVHPHLLLPRARAPQTPRCQRSWGARCPQRRSEPSAGHHGGPGGLIPPRLWSQSYLPTVLRGMTQTIAQRSKKEKWPVLSVNQVKATCLSLRLRGCDVLILEKCLDWKNAPYCL